MERTTTSGRREPTKKSPSLAPVAIIVVALVIVLVVVFRPKATRAGPLRPPPQRVRRPTNSPPEITPQSPFVGEGEDLEEVETAAPPTPEPSACVRFSWRAGLKAGAEEPAPVEITLVNGCGFEGREL